MNMLNFKDSQQYVSCIGKETASAFPLKGQVCGKFQWITMEMGSQV
jgi:hypothetical protein